MKSKIGNKQERVKINVVGTIYETYYTTLQKFPTTLLGNQEKRIRYYDFQRSQFYFNRNRLAFEAILFDYQSGGRLLRPPELPMEAFKTECMFFELDEDAVRSLEIREGVAVPQHEAEDTDELCLELKPRTWRHMVWDFLEFPASSRGAAIFSMCSMSMVIASITVLCLSSIPEMKAKQIASLEKNPWFRCEFGLNLYFAIEFIVKLAFAPCRLKFLKSPLNAIDIFAVFPFFIVLAIDSSQIANLAFLRALRTLRVLRLFRFSKQSKTLKVVLSILSSCVKDLFLLVFCMLITTTVCASIAYYVEAGSPRTTFFSIPHSMWWGIQTIVCLGYGDIVPVTLAGKIAGGIVAVFGALTLTVPLLSLGGKYLSRYNQQFANPLGPDF